MFQAAKQNATKKKSKKSGAGLAVDETTEDLEMDETALMLLEDDEDTNDQTAEIGDSSGATASASGATQAAAGSTRLKSETQQL